MTSPHHSRARRVGVGNDKGGTGKTSGTINVAASLAEQGFRVLVVDLDPQSNATRRLNIPRNGGHVTISDVLRVMTERGVDPAMAGCIEDAFIPCGWPEPYSELITVVPARTDLENRVLEAGQAGAVHRLAISLDGADDDFDLTIIDCPPNLGHLTQMALASLGGPHDTVLCMLDPEIDGIEGAVALRDFVAAKRTFFGVPQLAVGGYVVNRIDIRLGSHKYQVEESIPEVFGDQVWTRIGERAIVKDAADADPPRPLRTFGRDGEPMARVYDEVAAKLLAHVQLSIPRVEAEVQ